MANNQVFHRVIVDPELGCVEQFIRRAPNGQLVGWEIYDDGQRSGERIMGYESDSQLRARGYEVTSRG